MRTRSKDRAAARAGGAAPEEIPEADLLGEDADLDELDTAEVEAEPDDVADELSADEGSGEE